MVDKVLQEHNDIVLVQLYDVLFSAPVEKDSILKLIGHGDGMLIEPGCGTGRLAIPLAKQGWNVLGFDIDPRVLRLAQDKINGTLHISSKLSLVKADMMKPWPQNDCDVALIGYNLLLLCDSRDKQIAVIENAYNCLARGGRLIVSIKRPIEFDGMVRQMPPVKFQDKIYIMSISRNHNQTTDIFQTTYLVHAIKPNGESSHFVSNWSGMDISGKELTTIALNVGFKLKCSFGGYNGESLLSDSRVVLCEFVAP